MSRPALTRRPLAAARLSVGQPARLAHLALAGILILAAGLRFYRLDGSSLWSDEGNTWALVQRSWSQIARDAALDIHPPGYYWLLKGWTGLFGLEAAALRSLSALLGVGLTGVVYAIGARRSVSLGLAAALLVALNPLQVYYSQEARMYMLLALLGAGLFWALGVWLNREGSGAPVLGPALGYILCGILGLWTHYTFPILLLAGGLAYLWRGQSLLRRQPNSPQAPRRLLTFVLANVAILLGFAPWLPTAVERVLNWPKGGVAVSMHEGLALALRTLAFGPLRTLPDPLWPWLLIAGLLPLLGLAALLRAPHSRPLGVAWGLWLLAPVGLMFALGLFSDAFLKFLLAASPAWALLVAAAPGWLPRPAAGHLALLASGAALALVALPAYYTGPTVRDNYAGVARYIAAVADPAAALVVLDAPGQADVWSYYNPGLPVLALPRERPPDPTATEAALAEALADRREVYALFWATDEADPNRIVESWLDRNAFRGLESWQGNVRFVVYSLPNRLVCRELAPAPTFGDAIALLAHCQPDFPETVAAGQQALAALRWQSAAPLAQRYKVSVQMLDAANQVIAQHDAEPAGGSQPTDAWTPGEPVVDNHGLYIPPGTPPGRYRLIVALYDEATGARLPTPDGDTVALGEIEVVRPAQPLPATVVPIRVRVEQPLGPATLVGYDIHRKGFSHAPETPLQPGDLVHVTLLWQAPAPLPPDWPTAAAFTLRLGDQTLTAPLAGPGFPTGAWQAGDLARGEFDIPFDGSDLTPELTIAGDRLQLERLPQ
ncbi:MAG TPA: glycosyltransferase family 39 protein [Caldilineaceae bacterium]|nr:glycosyltransferase family 39 protein [Caldilineaceae bacterium]